MTKKWLKPFAARDCTLGPRLSKPLASCTEESEMQRFQHHMPLAMKKAGPDEASGPAWSLFEQAIL